MKDLMTRDEFISYAHEVLFGEASECLLEQIAEFRNEVAMFGDAGPGTGLRVIQSVQEYNTIGRRWAQLTGGNFRPLTVRYG